MTFVPFRPLCLALLLFIAPLAHAWERPEMAKFGAAYHGPEQLEVYTAHNKADDHAVIKIRGINHPIDGHVFWTKITYSQKNRGYPNHITYIDESIQEEHKRAVLFIEDSSGILYLPDYRGQARVEIPVRYDKEASKEILPEHLLTDYERQIGVTE